MKGKQKILFETDESQFDSDDKVDDIEIRDIIEDRPRGKLSLLNPLSLIVLHVLDILLLIILLPYMLWKWISANDQMKVVLKAIVEVTLELIMWVIFAGVSIIMTAKFVLEDSYFSKDDTEELRQLLDSRNVLMLNNNDENSRVPDSPNVWKEKSKIPEKEQS